MEPEPAPRFPGARPEGDPARLAAGWERRFVADARRAEEAVQLYEQMGYEACADPVGPADLSDGCEDCRLVELLGFRTVYTRERPER